jgi:hypothetical protein
MEVTARVGRQILLLSLLILIPPMLLFPERLGTGLAKASLINAMYELVYYGVIVFIFNRRTTLIQMAQAAGFCLIYRLFLGAVLGVLIAMMYTMSLSVALTLGMSSYLPAILLHIAATPFILRPVVAKLLPVGMDRIQHQEPAPPIVAGQTRTPISTPADKRASDQRMTKPPEYVKRDRPKPQPHRTPATGSTQVNGFDRATRYIGEDGSVQLAVVVDCEGLVLGHFTRGEIDPEDWAPFALMFSDTNRRLLTRAELGAAEKIDLQLQDKRVVVARVWSFSLMVIAQRQSDDVLSIRINQALEIVRKYVTERYDRKQPVNVERVYASSTQ